MKNPVCPFCSPHADKASFAESDHFKAIYNIAPILPGHVLVVPKQHVTGFLDVDDAQMTELMIFSRKLILFLKKEFKADGVDFTIQDGKSAGQTIDHMHVHIVPRYKGDLADPGDWYPSIQSKNSEMLDSLQRKHLSNAQMKRVIAHLKTSYQTF